MALSTEERERIREEEWVRALAREDFQRLAARRPLLHDDLTGVATTFAYVIGLMAVMGIFIRFIGGAGF
jgi:hypothetical protein